MPRAVPPSLRQWLEDARDWSQTELGPVCGWSPDLLTAVASSLPLGSVSLLWGPNLIRVYGPAYAPIMGGRHPHGLGRPVGEEWPEAWAKMAPHVEEVRRSGDIVTTDQVVVADRFGFPERLHLHVTFNPVCDHDTGAVLGVVASAEDRTDAVLARERASTLARVGEVGVDGKSVRSTVRCALAATVADSHDLLAEAVVLAPCAKPPCRKGLASSTPDAVVELSLGPAPDGFADLAQRIGQCYSDGCVQGGDGCRFESMDTATPTADEAAGRDVSEQRNGIPHAAECRKLPGTHDADDVGRLVVALDSTTRATDSQHVFLRKLANLTARVIRDARAQNAERDQVQNLTMALDTNRTIGAAMGVLMALRKIGPDEAFNLLRETSQHANRKLRQVAEYVLETGTLPERAKSPSSPATPSTRPLSDARRP